jgi:phage shock protein PspC (stress-responsive transcriptional regulator)
MPQARLMRSSTDRMFAGVCGGIAAYLAIDAVLVRLAFVLLSLASGVGLLLYLVLMILMPSEESVGQPGSAVAEKNMERLGEDISSGVDRMRSHPQGPTIGAGLLILLGVYLLLDNLGWMPVINWAIIWSLAIIGLGIYLITRRNR